MKGFTHFIGNDDNFILNTLCHQFKGEGYATYYALCESICVALDHDPDNDDILIYYSAISKRSHLGLKKTKKILKSFEEILEKSDKLLEKSEVFLKISEIEISQLPEIVAFRSYKVSKVKRTKLNIIEAKATAPADAVLLHGSANADLLTKMVEEFGKDFVNSHFDNACQYFDTRVKGDDRDKWIRDSLLRSEEKFGCPYKAQVELANFDWND